MLVRIVFVSNIANFEIYTLFKKRVFDIRHFSNELENQFRNAIQKLIAASFYLFVSNDDVESINNPIISLQVYFILYFMVGF